MLKIKLILCPIDFSEFSARAYQHAVSLAEHYRSKLVALHVVELFRFPYLGFTASADLYEQACDAIVERGKDKLREFVKDTRTEIQLELAVDDGIAADCILAFAEARKTDVIVMGTHGRRGYDRLTMGSVTDRVMRRASCPALVVCGPPRDSMAADREREHVHVLRRILFCTDFSQNSEVCLGHAISVTAEYDAELTLLHVLEDAPSPAKSEETIAAAKAQLDALIPPEARKAIKIRTAVRIGKPYQQIIQFAQETQTDMITMGARGRGSLDAAIFGSTTYRVMQLGPCPVLAVRV
jgi:nucleotide-binding universal stress UspA family protein